MNRKLLITISATDSYCGNVSHPCEMLIRETGPLKGTAFRCRIFSTCELKCGESHVPLRAGECKRAGEDATAATVPKPGVTHCYDCSRSLRGVWPPFKRWVSSGPPSQLNTEAGPVEGVEPPTMTTAFLCHHCRENYAVSGWPLEGPA